MNYKRIPIESHHSEQELLNLEKSTRDMVLRERIHAIRLLHYSDYSKKELVKIFGRCRTKLLSWSHQYNEAGIDGLISKPKKSGRYGFFEEIGLERIRKRLELPPDDGGLWTTKKLKVWLEQQLGRRLSKHYGWHMMKRLEFTLQVPRPGNPKADLEAQASFKK